MAPGFVGEASALNPETEVYRALTKEGIASDKSFRLNPNEDSLSIALTVKKALGTLTCRGFAVLTVGRIQAIPNLRVQVKRPELQAPEGPLDYELLEVMGLPRFQDDAAVVADYALALVKAVVRQKPFDRKVKCPLSQAELDKLGEFPVSYAKYLKTETE